MQHDIFKIFCLMPGDMMLRIAIFECSLLERRNRNRNSIKVHRIPLDQTSLVQDYINVKCFFVL